MKAKKKPVEIEFYPCHIDFLDQIMKWSTRERPIKVLSKKPFVLTIETLEGTYKANEGDMILKGIIGEVYPCKTDIFLDSYNVTDGKY